MRKVSRFRLIFNVRIPSDGTRRITMDTGPTLLFFGLSSDTHYTSTVGTEPVQRNLASQRTFNRVLWDGSLLVTKFVVVFRRVIPRPRSDPTFGPWSQIPTCKSLFCTTVLPTSRSQSLGTQSRSCS